MDMVPHDDFFEEFPHLKSNISEDDKWTSNDITTRQMKCFLRTRHGCVEGTNSLAHAGISAAVRALLRRECDSPMQPLFLRDPSGQCMYRYLLNHDHVSAVDYAQYDDSKMSPSEFKIKYLEEYDSYCANISRGQVRQYLKDYDAVDNVEVKPMI